MNKNIKLPPTIEISSAVLMPHLTETDLQRLHESPNQFLKTKFNVDIDIDIQVVCNDSQIINLVLPYYSQIEALQIEMLKDNRLDEIVGGEILVLVGAGAGAAIGWGFGFSITSAVIGGLIGGTLAGGAGAIIGTITAVAVHAADDENIDGTPK